MKAIQVNELVNKITNKEEVNVIDVREPYELLDGKIPGAVNIPLGQIPYRLKDLDKNTPYYVVCLSGARSQGAVQFLENHGYDVTNLTGGMMFYQGPTGV
ncbi:rhodanese-like domain-containing protein [Halolactibacillus alkaliphilus]|uniref:Rhodanese-like domain-containing protein n=1 Tax=Halolactibacillus alkaliphilus TaxID=442899 RepID=A0A511X3W9_9BACI|nr:rhodanese-like domain-containing protein [Halolactibacillus alkaliphilus]GEN57605.1 rhodanese-like domain-containing protein [Halolactibacillus alkaliphilus]GGN74427.1 rhodanese-like domain-containing protein [Halolactibacillus alkaliphilus]SFP01447.1 Rhodanese-related sulfurtransferase [Halolactibacillus alkaliphilus]